MTDRDELLQEIKDHAVVHGKVTLASRREADYWLITDEGVAGNGEPLPR